MLVPVAVVWVPFHRHGITLIPAWLYNHMPMPVKCEMKLLIHSQNSTAAPLKFENGWNYLYTLELKSIHVIKRSPRWEVPFFPVHQLSKFDVVWSLRRTQQTCAGKETIFLLENYTSNSGPDASQSHWRCKSPPLISLQSDTRWHNLDRVKNLRSSSTLSFLSLSLTWFHHVIKTLSALSAICEGTTDDRWLLSQKTCNSKLWFFSAVGVNNLPNEQSRCRWFQTPWCSCSVTRDNLVIWKINLPAWCALAICHQPYATGRGCLGTRGSL